MAVTGGCVVIIVTLSLFISGVLTVSPPAILQCGQCPPNEVLRQSPPACEPTCYNDCQHVPSQYPQALCYKPTCVCRPGFVRHQGVCIPREQCFRPTFPLPRPHNPNERYCNSNEDLLRSPPCCEPTCFDDCSNKICPLSFIDRPTCVCKTGLVRHNGNCINPRQCPLARSRDESSEDDDEDDDDDGETSGGDDSGENKGGRGKSNSRSGSGRCSSSSSRSKGNSRSDSKSRSKGKSKSSKTDSSEENDDSNNDNVSFKEVPGQASSSSQQSSCGKNICGHPKLPCQNKCLPPPPVAPRHPCGACNKNKF